MKYKLLFLILVFTLLFSATGLATNYADYLDHELIRDDGNNTAGVIYTPICNINCDLPIRFSVDLPMSVQINNGDLVEKFIYGNGMSQLEDYGIDILVQQEYKQSCNLNQVANGSLQVECINDSNGNITIDNSYWTPLTFPFQFNGQQDYYFNLWGVKNGDKKNGWVDAVPTFFGYDLPYAYWNSTTNADTYVETWKPTESNGNDVDIGVGLRGSAGQKNYGYINWTLDDIPADATINDAYFTILVDHVNFCGSPWNMTIHRVTSSWDEAVTYNTKPTNDTLELGRTQLECGGFDNTNITMGNDDFTNVVRGWVNGTYTNYGIVLLFPDGAGASGQEWNFNSSEAGGSPPYLVVDFDAPENIYSVTLNSPADSSYNSSSDMTFNCSASDDTNNIDNITLFIDGEANYTETGGVSGDLELFTKVNLSEAEHTWTCRSYNSLSEINWSASNYTFTLDTTNPVPYIAYPTNDSELFSLNPALNTSLNFSYTDTNPTSNCWYDVGAGNTSITCGLNATYNFTAGSHSVKYYVNDSAGNWDYTTAVFSVNYLQGVFNITSPVIEGQPNSILFNLTATNISSIVGNLTWNNSVYELNISNTSTQALFTTLFTTPAVPSDSTINLWVNYTLNNGFTGGFATTQLVENYYSLIFNETTCPAGYTEGIHLDWNDEGNLTQIYNITMDYLFRYGVYNNTFETINGTMTNIETASICFNATQLDNYSIGYGEIQYRKTGWVDKRYYIFENTILNNITKNYTLYNLITGDATSFLFTIKYNSGEELVNKYLGLLRWYPQLDQYLRVGMGRTDDKGQSVLRVETEDADYRIAVYEENGSLIHLAEPIRMLCLDSPCSYTLNIDPNTADYLTTLGIQNSLTYNSATGIILFTYNDPSGDTETMTLRVTREGGITSTLVCNNSASGATGVITCNVTGQTGDLKAIVFKSNGYLEPLNSLFISMDSSVFSSSIGLFFTAVLLIFVAVSGIISPYLPIILGILAFIPALALGAVSVQIFIAIVVIGGITIHFLNRL